MELCVYILLSPSFRNYAKNDTEFWTLFEINRIIMLSSDACRLQCEF
jgi:hypothetical protein